MKKRKLFIILASLLFIMAVFSLIYIGKKTGMPDKNPYISIIEMYSEKYSVDRLLIEAVMKRESNINKNAVSAKGAVGLMQIMPRTAEEIALQLGIGNYNAEMLKDPEINIMFGTYYLSWLTSYYNNNLILALAAYNAGIGNVDIWYEEDPKVGKCISKIPFKETKRHTRGIVFTYKVYKGVDKLKRAMTKTPR